jgi:hypothetical protein
MKLLLRSGLVSFQRNHHLLRQAIASQRYDVLAEIMRFVSDLNEEQAVYLLNLSISVPAAELVRTIVLRKRTYCKVFFFRNVLLLSDKV